MNARELLARLTALLGKALDVDEGFRFGDQMVEVRGVLVCWMCDPEAIEAAMQAGANVIVCHEALYSPYDIVDGQQFGSQQRDWLSWPTNLQRVKLLAKHDLTVIRLHGSVDRLCIFDAFVRQLGLGKPVVDEPEYVKLFEIEPVTVGELARRVKEKLGLSAVRFSAREMDRRVRRIGVPWGGMGLFVNVAYVNALLAHRPDVLIAGETDNYGFRFAAEAGVDVIETSHETSEHAGLEEFTRRVRATIALPVRYYANPVVWKSV